MALNVMDKNGEHLGVIVARFKEFYLAAVTEVKVEEIIDQKETFNILAPMLDCRTMLGKTKVDKLEEKLNQWWQERGLPSEITDLFLAARAYMFDRFSFWLMNLWERCPSNTYLILEQNKLESINKNGALPLELSKNEIIPVPEDLGPGLVAEVTTYPIINLHVRGFFENFGADLADLGVNHTHHTTLQLNNGGCCFELELYQTIITHKGERIILQLKPPGKNQVHATIEGIFAGGLLYTGNNGLGS